MTATARLATFNIMNGRSLLDGRVDADRFASAVRELDADVLGLQEVDHLQDRSGGQDLTEVAARAGGATAYRFAAAIIGTPGGRVRPVTDADAGDGEPRYGVGLVSRWPVTSWGLLRLAAAPVRSPIYVPGPRGGLLLLEDEPRVLVTARIESPYGPLTVGCTHLSFVPGWNVRQLRHCVRHLRSLPGPRVLLGDLNLPGVLATAVSRWRSAGALPTFPAPAPRVQLDHVLVDQRDRAGLPDPDRAYAPALPVSDHRPLVATFGPARR